MRKYVEPSQGKGGVTLSLTVSKSKDLVLGRTIGRRALAGSLLDNLSMKPSLYTGVARGQRKKAMHPGEMTISQTSVCVI